MESKLDINDFANAIRALTIDAVESAKSGHPGAPMGMADIAHVLWTKHLVHNPSNPNWFNRDRFILSNGHASMLIYSLLHLTGYNVSISDLKNFRQLDSKTPGHPEYGETPGVETTTGPLGQGLGNAVGFAIAEKVLAERFNQNNLNIVDHRTYAFVGDGCLMEGISHECCSLAGTLKLNKLMVLYDRNGISIDGEVSAWFSEDIRKRFEAYGWHVIDNVDGHNQQEIDEAIKTCKAVNDKPQLICCDTVIGFGSPNKAGTSDSHGAPLGNDEIAATKKALNWEHKPFYIPDEIYAHWDCKVRGENAEEKWNAIRDKYKEEFPSKSSHFERLISNNLPDNWSEDCKNAISKIINDKAKEATRKSSQVVLDHLGEFLPELTGGSADLTGSNNTFHKHSVSWPENNEKGNYIFYGVREFGMTAITNGISLHGGIIPYSGTFLVFSDYARNGVRMAALMGLRNIFVYTHDSIGLGEDGPTHQPVEHINSLRIIPNLDVWRPSDRVETFVAWTSSIEKRKGPSCIILSRQSMEQNDHDSNSEDQIRKGAYIVLEPQGKPRAVIIATGSEVNLAKKVAASLNEEAQMIRVISMPCEELYSRQPSKVKNSIIPPDLEKIITIEAGTKSFWHKYTGKNGLTIGIDSYGASAPGGELYEKFGISFVQCKNIIKNYLK